MNLVTAIGVALAAGVAWNGVADALGVVWYSKFAGSLVLGFWIGSALASE